MTFFLIPVTENFHVPTITMCGFGTLGESLSDQNFFILQQGFLLILE